MLPTMRTSFLELWTLLWSRLPSSNADREAPAELDATIQLVWFLQWWLGCFLQDCLNVFLLFSAMRLSYFLAGWRWSVKWHWPILLMEELGICISHLEEATSVKGLVTGHFLLLMAWTSGTIVVGTLELFPHCETSLLNIYSRIDPFMIYLSQTLSGQTQIYSNTSMMGKFSCFFVS